MAAVATAACLHLAGGDKDFRVTAPSLTFPDTWGADLVMQVRCRAARFDRSMCFCIVGADMAACQDSDCSCWSFARMYLMQRGSYLTHRAEGVVKPAGK